MIPLGPASIVEVGEAAERLGGVQAIAWLRTAGVVRRLLDREVVVWGDVVDAVRELEPVASPAVRPRGAPSPARSKAAGDVFLTLAEAARELGVSDKTLRRRLEGAAAKVEGGPVDVSEGVRRHWRFPRETLHDWWRTVCAGPSRPAKPAARRARPAAPRSTSTGAVDWSAEATRHTRRAR